MLLGAAARELLDGLAASASGEWVFPGRGADEPLDRNDLWTFWTGALSARTLSDGIPPDSAQII